jgi:hypothetical protein
MRLDDEPLGPDELEALRARLEREREARMDRERRERGTWRQRRAGDVLARVAAAARRCPRCWRPVAVGRHSYAVKEYCSALCREEHKGRKVMRCRRCGARHDGGETGRRLYCTDACRTHDHLKRARAEAAAAREPHRCSGCPAMLVRPNQRWCSEACAKRARRRAIKAA